MTRIFLMRHAKATPAAGKMADFDRPLEATGRRDAERVGSLLRSAWGLPDAIVCSGARRTRETLDALGLSIDGVRFSDDLFDGEAADYLHTIQETSAQSVMVIGHNPSIHEATQLLNGSGEETLRARLAAGFPTATLAILDGSGPLASVAPGRCRLEALIGPQGAY